MYIIIFAERELYSWWYCIHSSKNLFQGPSLKSETVLDTWEPSTGTKLYLDEGREGMAGCTSTTTTLLLPLRLHRLLLLLFGGWGKGRRWVVALLPLLLLLLLLLLLVVDYYFHLRAGKGWAGCTSGLSADQAFWVLREEVSADSDQCITTSMYYYYSNHY